MALTKSWLQKQITDLEATRDEIPFGLDEDGNNTLAALKMALAGMEADSKLSDFVASQESLGVDFEKVLAENIEELYVPSKSAPPAPVSAPDELAGKSFEYIANKFQVSISEAQWVLVGWNACRAAMLQGKAEPATTAYNLPDDFDFDRFNDVVWLEAVASNPHMHSPTTSTIAMVALELNRKLDATGNSSVIPDGWVACSERMPHIGVPVIICCGDVVQYAAYSWDGKQWQDWYEEYDKLPASTFTHWHSRPAAPQQGAE